MAMGSRVRPPFVLASAQGRFVGTGPGSVNLLAIIALERNPELESLRLISFPGCRDGVYSIVGLALGSADTHVTFLPLYIMALG
jgi:hypothetical protein